jgi:hypothetical protein
MIIPLKIIANYYILEESSENRDAKNAPMTNIIMIESTTAISSNIRIAIA